MQSTEIIEIMGGRKEVMKITGLTKGRVHQFVSEDYIPRHWLLLFHQMKPRLIPHPSKLKSGAAVKNSSEKAVV